MSEAEVIEIIKNSLNELLRWVGFGTLTGLAAKAIKPGRDPGGAVGTMLMGIGGSVIGCGTVLFFWRDAQIDPISGKGFVAATLGAFTLLFFYRLIRVPSQPVKDEAHAKSRLLRCGDVCFGGDFCGPADRRARCLR